MKEQISLGNYGANHGTRIIALADRNSTADHPDHLAVRRVELIIRLHVWTLPALGKSSCAEKWLIKSNGRDLSPATA
jgi:hypothetical protein